MAFMNETSVLKHMNHRFSSCNSFFLNGDSLVTHPSSPPHILVLQSSPLLHSTTFPDAGHVYGRGDGYMGMFHEDTYAAERTLNLYYPF